MSFLPFEIKNCPQDCGEECGADLAKCPTYQKLPAPLQEICQKSLHLLQYLHAFPLDELGIPEYYEKLNRSLKGAKNPNLFYPTSNEVFVHVLANLGDVRDHYIPVEPSLADAQDNLLDEIEQRLAEFVEELEGVADASKRVEIIMKIVDRLVVVRSGNGSKPAQPDGKSGKPGALEGAGKTKKAIEEMGRKAVKVGRRDAAEAIVDRLEALAA